MLPGCVFDMVGSLPRAAQAVTYGAGLLGSSTFTQSLAFTQPLTQSSSTKPVPAIPIVQSQQPINGIACPPRAYGHASGNSVQYANYRSVLESHDNVGDGSTGLFEIPSSHDISWPRLVVFVTVQRIGSQPHCIGSQHPGSSRSGGCWNCKIDPKKQQ